MDQLLLYCRWSTQASRRLFRFNHEMLEFECFAWAPEHNLRKENLTARQLCMCVCVRGAILYIGSGEACADCLAGVSREADWRGWFFRLLHSIDWRWRERGALSNYAEWVSSGSRCADPAGPRFPYKWVLKSQRDTSAESDQGLMLYPGHSWFDCGTGSICTVLFPGLLLLWVERLWPDKYYKGWKVVNSTCSIAAAARWKHF